MSAVVRDVAALPCCRSATTCWLRSPRSRGFRCGIRGGAGSVIAAAAEDSGAAGEGSATPLVTCSTWSAIRVDAVSSVGTAEGSAAASSAVTGSTWSTIGACARSCIAVSRGPPGTSADPESDDTRPATASGIATRRAIAFMTIALRRTLAKEHEFVRLWRQPVGQAQEPKSAKRPKEAKVGQALHRGL
jgi:hypothetical protein